MIDSSLPSSLHLCLIRTDKIALVNCPWGLPDCPVIMVNTVIRDPSQCLRSWVSCTSRVEQSHFDPNGVDLTQYIESGFDSGTPGFSVFAARRMAHGTCLASTDENPTYPSAYVC